MAPGGQVRLRRDALPAGREEEYFAVRVGSPEVSLDGMEDVEKQTVTGYRWCTADDIESLGEPVAPADLPRILRELTAAPES